MAVQITALVNEPRDANALASPVRVAERYELRARLGHGTSGTVYEAHDITLDRRVALKLLDAGALAEAEREAKILAGVVHRNVVAIHDFGRCDGRRFLVLELLEGEDLGEWLARERRSATSIVAQFLAAGRGLCAAHEAGVAHGDFKSNNVIVTRRGRVVVVDFGLAQPLGHNDVNAALAQGTLAFMAPERLDGRGPDARSDQFSFCVSLWQALVGSSPFSGNDPHSRFESIRRGAPSRASSPRLRRALSRHWHRTLARGMAFDPGQRFPSMAELLTALERRSPEHRGVRPLFVALTAAATFLLGWGIAPSGPTLEAAESHSAFDLRADTALATMDAALDLAQQGAPVPALAHLRSARTLAASLGPEHPVYCRIGVSVPPLAEHLRAHDEHSARMAYAIALRFAQDCEALDSDELLAARESTRSSSLLSGAF